MSEHVIIDRDLKLAVINLHDAFLNASIVHHMMQEAPVDPDDTQLASDRFRLERLWIALLAVLVESWNSDQMAEARRFLRSCSSTDALEALLGETELGGRASPLFKARHYMFHRDRREFWNEGRFGPVGRLEQYSSLHQAFSSVLLAGV